MHNLCHAGLVVKPWQGKVVDKGDQARTRVGREAYARAIPRGRDEALRQALDAIAKITPEDWQGYFDDETLEYTTDL
jgi:hypothetical protein